MPEDTRFAYAVARIRAEEKKLLDNSRLEKMLDAKTAEDTLKVIIEAGYGNSSDDLTDAGDFEKLLMQENEKVFSLIKAISPDKDLFELFLLKNDYHNIKVALKTEFMATFEENTDLNGLFIDTGSIPLSKMVRIIKERKLSEIDEIMRKGIGECIEAFNRTCDPQLIDLILDKSCYMQMVKEAEKSGRAFVTSIVRIMVDLNNIKMFIRIKAMNKSWDFLQKYLLPGGTLDRSRFVKLFQDTVENAINTLRYTPYGSIFEDGINDFQKTGSLSEFEKLSDDYIIEFVKKAHYLPFGPEPLIGFLIAKQIEIKNIRIIMTGKINGITEEITRRRLREAYV